MLLLCWAYRSIIGHSALLPNIIFPPDQVRTGRQVQPCCSPSHASTLISTHRNVHNQIGPLLLLGPRGSCLVDEDHQRHHLVGGHSGEVSSSHPTPPTARSQSNSQSPSRRASRSSHTTESSQASELLSGCVCMSNEELCARSAYIWPHWRQMCPQIEATTGLPCRGCALSALYDTWQHGAERYRQVTNLRVPLFRRMRIIKHTHSPVRFSLCQ